MGPGRLRFAILEALSSGEGDGNGGDGNGVGE
jgi:hypothetical protein